MDALDKLETDRLTPGTIARMLELGAKLERSTLTVSVEELLGIDVTLADEEDPWERIARELYPHLDTEFYASGQVAVPRRNPRHRFGVPPFGTSVAGHDARRGRHLGHPLSNQSS
jgi:hypothetical protein